MNNEKLSLRTVVYMATIFVNEIPANKFSFIIFDSCRFIMREGIDISDVLDKCILDQCYIDGPSPEYIKEWSKYDHSIS